MSKYNTKSMAFAIGKLISLVYKVLCTYEECGNKFPIGYVNDVMSEVKSASDLLFDGELSYINVQLNKLNQSENDSHSKVKKIVFGCANDLCRIRDGVLNEQTSL